MNETMKEIMSLVVYKKNTYINNSNSKYL